MRHVGDRAPPPNPKVGVAMLPQNRPYPPDPTTARPVLSAAAIQALDLRRHLLATLTARQPLPITANRCQRAPNAPECPELPHLSQSLTAHASPSPCQP